MKKINNKYLHIWHWVKGGVGKSTALILTLLMVFIPLLSLTLNFFTTPKIVFAAHSRVGLGTVDNFAVLAGSAISDTGTTSVTGAVGLSPTGGASITGLTCAEINTAVGSLYDVDGGYAGGGGGSTLCRLTDSALLTTAKNDLTTAYNDAAGRSTTSTVNTELGGTTLTDGTYDSAAGTFGITGTLTLNGEGNADAVFIFKMASTLITASSSKVILTNSAQACNVYWQVGSSATLGTSTNLVGNVMALTSITDNGSSTVNGRLLARNGAVTLNNSTITRQLCAAGTAGAGLTALPAAAPTPTPGFKPATAKINSCPPFSSNVPIILELRRIDTDSIFVSWGPNMGINTFIVQYGPTNGNWQFSTNVTGYSTTINGLSSSPFWAFRVAATDGCSAGSFGVPKLVGGGLGGGGGGPLLPSTGLAPHENNTPWYVTVSIGIAILAFHVLIQRKHKFSQRH